MNIHTHTYTLTFSSGLFLPISNCEFELDFFHTSEMQSRLCRRGCLTMLGSLTWMLHAPLTAQHLSPVSMGRVMEVFQVSILPEELCDSAGNLCHQYFTNMHMHTHIHPPLCYPVSTHTLPFLLHSCTCMQYSVIMTLTVLEC